MRDRVFVAVLGLVLVAKAIPAVAVKPILLKARDLEDRPLPGLSFAADAIVSRPTNRAGATELNLSSDQRVGQQIKLQLVTDSKRAQGWLLVNPQVNIPSASEPAEVVLMRRSSFRQIAAEVRDRQRQIGSRPSQIAAGDPKRTLIDAATRYGLSAEQAEAALRSFADTQDPRDRGIASYLEGHYAQAEEILAGAVEKKKSDLVDTLLYLGASRYDQGKYQAAADTFRAALVLHPEDEVLLSRLTSSLLKLAAWPEAEPLLRRALSISAKSHGPHHPAVAAALNNLAELLKATNRLGEAERLLRRALTIAEKGYAPDHTDVARCLNNLAQLLLATNRPSEAEPLMRRALKIDEKSFGPDHPDVATSLKNLAQLLEDTNRLGEAEPLMRRALAIHEKSYGLDHPEVAGDLSGLAGLFLDTKRLSEAEPLLRRALTIDEKSFGPDHPDVATVLKNLAQLLKDTNRLGEAEPLMRRALAIHEKSYGLDHPEVAGDLSGLAGLFLDTKRLSEAEPLLRRALTIDEKSFGPDHPAVAIALNNLAQLLQATKRLGEAEPLMRRALAIDEKSYGPDHPAVAIALNNLAQLLLVTKRLIEAEPLMRRALTIFEKSYGPDHPAVATTLNNLALLLKATNRLGEAQPLMRRAIEIAVEFQRRSGHEHPNQAAILSNYKALLEAINEPSATRAAAASSRRHPKAKGLRASSSFAVLLGLLGAILTLGAWLWLRSPGPSPPPPKPRGHAIRAQVFDMQGRPVAASTVRTSADDEPKRMPDGRRETEVQTARVLVSGLVSLQTDLREREGIGWTYTWGRIPTQEPRSGSSNRKPRSWGEGGRWIWPRPVLWSHFSKRRRAGSVDDRRTGQRELKLAAPQETSVRLRIELTNFSLGRSWPELGPLGKTAGRERR
jgi:tetratricopeptide (TPR) repeat protein